MAMPRKEVDPLELPYPHRNAAADLLISKAQKLADLSSLFFGDLGEKEIKKARQAVSFYDLALHLMKPYDGNYSTIIHWKCLLLIVLEQYEEATSWYEELIRLTVDSEGPNYRCATAKEAEKQLSKIKGKKNSPLPEFKDKDGDLLDDPQFCWWSSQFCEALSSRKFKLAHDYLSDELGKKMGQTDLKNNWTSLLNDPKADTDVFLERYELASADDANDYVGWCYFVVSGDDINEAVSMEIYHGEGQGYEIRSIEFGRP
jgi:hypothetical protein